MDITHGDGFNERVKRAAHDVRTPLTTIAGFADLLLEESALSPSARESATTIVEETRRLSAMLEAFFDDISRRDET